MAVILQITYSKKLGLPNFSSHSLSVSVTAEISDVSAVGSETAKLYSLLQQSVDGEIKAVGWMPDASVYGMKPSQNGNGHTPNGNGHSTHGNGHHGHSNGSNGHDRSPERWNCTEGQKGLIQRLVNEHQLDKSDVEAMSQQLFGVGVKEMDKMQASQLIEDLIEKTGGKSNGRRKWSPRQPTRP